MNTDTRTRSGGYFCPHQGRWITADEAPDIVPDGGVVRVGMTFMDGTPRDMASEAQRVLDDGEERRTAAYDAYCHSLDNGTPTKSNHFLAPQHESASITDASSAYEEYCRDLQSGNYHKGDFTNEH